MIASLTLSLFYKEGSPDLGVRSLEKYCFNFFA
jgi:hypothetical protein